MIKVALTNSILKQIPAIDKNRFSLNTIALPSITHSRLKKNSRKKALMPPTK